jgi:hypothetical protein
MGSEEQLRIRLGHVGRRRYPQESSQAKWKVVPKGASSDWEVP